MKSSVVNTSCMKTDIPYDIPSSSEIMHELGDFDRFCQNRFEVISMGLGFDKILQN